MNGARQPAWAGQRDVATWVMTTQEDGQTDRTKLVTDGSMANRWREDEQKKRHLGRVGLR